MDTLFHDDRVPEDREGQADALVRPEEIDGALPLGDNPEALAQASDALAEAPETSRALALTDVIAPRTGPGEALIRLAYRMGVPGHALAAPFRRASAPRLLAQVETPVTGDRTAGTALRAGHFPVSYTHLTLPTIYSV